MPTIAAGTSGVVAIDGHVSPSAGTWQILYSGSVIAFSTSSAGWTLGYSTGPGYDIGVPSGATVSTGSLYEFRASPSLVSGGGTGFVADSGHFDVGAALDTPDTDTFAGTAGTDLTTHTSETGGGWTLTPDSSAGATFVLDGTGLVQTAGGRRVDVLSTTPPTSADQDVSLDVTLHDSNSVSWVTARSNNSGSLATLDGYRAELSAPSGDITLRVFQMQGSGDLYNGLVSDPYVVLEDTTTLGLNVTGNTLTASVGGTVQATVTDTALTSAGAVGFGSDDINGDARDGNFTRGAAAPAPSAGSMCEPELGGTGFVPGGGGVPGVFDFANRRTRFNGVPYDGGLKSGSGYAGFTNQLDSTFILDGHTLFTMASCSFPPGATNKSVRGYFVTTETPSFDCYATTHPDTQRPPFGYIIFWTYAEVTDDGGGTHRLPFLLLRNDGPLTLTFGPLTIPVGNWMGYLCYNDGTSIPALYEGNGNVTTPAFTHDVSVTITVCLEDDTGVEYFWTPTTLTFVYQCLYDAGGADSSRPKSTLLAADLFGSNLAVAWIDSAGAVKVAYSPSARQCSGTAGFAATQTLETSGCSDIGFVYLPNGRAYLTYTQGGAAYYRTSDTFGRGNWTTKAAPNPAISRISQGGRAQANTFRAKANGNDTVSSISVHHERGHDGATWAADSATYPTGYGPLMGACATPPGSAYVYADAAQKIWFVAQYADDHIETAIDTTKTGYAASLSCLASGALIMAYLDSSWVGATGSTLRFAISTDNGTTWRTLSTTSTTVGAYPCVLVSDGDICYACQMGPSVLQILNFG